MSDPEKEKKLVPSNVRALGFKKVCMVQALLALLAIFGCLYCQFEIVQCYRNVMAHTGALAEITAPMPFLYRINAVDPVTGIFYHEYVLNRASGPILLLFLLSLAMLFAPPPVSMSEEEKPKPRVAKKWLRLHCFTTMAIVILLVAEAYFSQRFLSELSIAALKVGTKISLETNSASLSVKELGTERTFTIPNATLAFSVVLLGVALASGKKIRAKE